ncbi:MAG TPA: hypothetical protein PL073_10545 [Spirochaetota bacterium]|nr:hypothetical protein [Spirochaetota bacterium]
MHQNDIVDAIITGTAFASYFHLSHFSSYIVHPFATPPILFFERRPGVRLSPVTIALDIIAVTNDNNYKIV